MMTRLLRFAVAVAALVAAAESTAGAQDSRADIIAQAQAEKAQHAAPYVPSRAEEIATQVQHRFFETPSGFYPWLDSVYGGGGFTLGAGYRDFSGDRTFWDVRGLYSMKSYKRLEVVTTSLGLAGDRVDLQAIGGWRDATQVAFYGLGADTTKDTKSNFGMQQFYAGAHARVRGPVKTVLGLSLQLEDYLIKSGSGSSPSTENVFTPATAPGVDSDPAFLHTTIGGGFDTRPNADYARRGGLYTVTYDNWADRDQTYDFDRVTAEVVQHLPILRENWVVSLHGLVQTTLDDQDVVPFFLLPSLGSGSTLRAYSSWRFRDRHSLLMSGEWRWIPSRLAMDMAFFFDAGKVASRREDLDFDNLTTDFGVGVRFHSPVATPLRIDVAHGGEGLNIVFSGSAAF
jgi:outer membrane protein assembly factor BamA